MVTVASIADAAFDGVASAITDAVLSATLNDGTTNYSGRVVFGGEKAPTGFPLSEAKGRAREAYLEGFSAAAAAGWTLVAGGATYYVMGIRDIVEAGTFIVANVIKQSDMLWKTAAFETPTNTSDGSGGYTESWAAIVGYDAVSVGLMAVSGQERWASDRIEATTRFRAICVPVTGLTEADRVVIDSKAYNITFINDAEGRGIWQVLDLSGGVAT